MITFFQSLGAVVATIIVIVTTVLLLYLSYILAIGFLIIASVFITYHLIKTVKSEQ